MSTLTASSTASSMLTDEMLARFGQRPAVPFGCGPPAGLEPALAGALSVPFAEPLAGLSQVPLHWFIMRLSCSGD